MSVASNSWSAAVDVGERALARYRDLRDPLGIPRAKHLVGTALLHHHGRTAEAEPLLQDALDGFRPFGEGRYVGFSLARLAFVRGRERDFAAARTHHAEALAIFKTLGAARGAAIVASNLAEVEFLAGDAEAALRLAADALATYRVLKYTNIVTHALVNIAGYLVALTRYDEARAHAREALELARELELETIAVSAIQHLAAVAALKPQSEVERTSQVRATGARLTGFVDARLDALQIERESDYTEQQEYDRVLAALRGWTTDENLADLMASGAAMNVERAIEEALTI